MSEEATTTCSACEGELQNLGVLGKLLYSRCRDCGLEHRSKVAESSIDTFISLEEINTLRECITCSARYAAAGDPDLCPDCRSSFLGRTAANDHISEMSAPVNCDFCDMIENQVRASYDGRTKSGAWGYMCEDHFKEHGVGLGLGTGQKLVYPDSVDEGTTAKVKKEQSEMKQSSDNAHPNGELQTLIQQQRQDTSRWQDGENHSPNPNVNPADLVSQDEAPAVDRTPETTVESGPIVERTNDSLVAKVFSSEENIEGAKVLLQDGDYQVVGKVELEAEDGFLVEWRTGRKSIEKKANYELVVVSTQWTTDSCASCGAQLEDDDQYVCKNCEDQMYENPSPKRDKNVNAKTGATEVREEWKEHLPNDGEGWMEEDLPEGWTPGDCVACGHNDAMRNHPDKLCIECADQRAMDSQADLEIERRKGN